MTKKLFWKNPYQAELETTVTSIEGNCITLKETIFFAFSGGQESDGGLINGIKVINAQKNGKEIFYTFEQEPNFLVSNVVSVKIDWARRYSLMRLHFAAELVLVVCQKIFLGIEKIGAHISQEKSRIDFLWSESIASKLKLIEEEVNKLIEKDLKIISDFSDEENERRFWCIEGLAKIPCGGTHPKTTKELGSIKLKRENSGKGKERVVIFLT